MTLQYHLFHSVSSEKVQSAYNHTNHFEKLPQKLPFLTTLQCFFVVWKTLLAKKTVWRVSNISYSTITWMLVLQFAAEVNYPHTWIETSSNTRYPSLPLTDSFLLSASKCIHWRFCNCIPGCWFTKFLYLWSCIMDGSLSVCFKLR